MLGARQRRTADRTEDPAGTAPRADGSENPSTESDLYGEYSSPTLSAPGWGFASLLMAAPGVILPWVLPMLLRNGYHWSDLRPLLVAVPLTALLGLVFGIVGVRREDGGVSALVGLGLNVVLVLFIAAIIVARYF